MNTITENMAAILALDSSARLELSTYTGKWFVQSHLSIGDGSFIKGITEHRDTPEQAVEAFLKRLRSHALDEYVTNGRSGDDRRNWRWTGLVFREVSTDSLRHEYAESSRS